MKIELKDYLHLYLGCECEVVNPYIDSISKRLDGFDIAQEACSHINYYNEQYHDGSVWHTIDRVKPLLRKLEDMTEEEAKELSQLSGRGGIAEIGTIVIRQDWSDAHYLLSKHFDLFGLIDAGIALDKNKIEKQHGKVQKETSSN